MSASDSRIEILQAKKAQLEAEIARRQARLKADARKADTRRKILIGALIMQEMKERPELDAWVRRLLSQRLQKPRDRALFDLHCVGDNDVLAS